MSNQLRLAIAGVNFAHDYVYPVIINGFEPEKTDKWFKKGWVKMYEGKTPSPLDPEVRIVKIWGEKKEEVKILAEVLHLEICENLEDLIEDIDGVLILEELTGNPPLRYKLVEPFLKKGIPVFLDKSPAEDLSYAEKIIDLAREYKTPFMSCSSLKFTREAEELKKEIPQIEPVKICYAIGPGELSSYGIHTISFLQSIFGTGVKSVQGFSEGEINLAKLQYEDGRIAIVQISKVIKTPFTLIIYGGKGYKRIEQKDSYSAYYETTRQMIKMFKEKKEPIPLEETLEIVKIVEAIQKSSAQKKEIRLR